VLLLPAAALLVHQLRYTLAYGPSSGAELAAQGHSYQHSLIPWTIFALGVGLWLFLRRLLGTLSSGDAGPLARVGLPALWAVTTLGLLAIYALQESLEGLYAAGHPGGVAGVFGHGGWWAVPAAAAVALAVVALLNLGRRLLTAAEHTARRPTWVLELDVPAPLAVAHVRSHPLASSAAGRAPPSAL
jgi:hypothetical protein